MMFDHVWSWSSYSCLQYSKWVWFWLTLLCLEDEEASCLIICCDMLLGLGRCCNKQAWMQTRPQLLWRRQPPPKVLQTAPRWNRPCDVSDVSQKGHQCDTFQISQSWELRGRCTAATAATATTATTAWWPFHGFHRKFCGSFAAQESPATLGP